MPFSKRALFFTFLTCRFSSSSSSSSITITKTTQKLPHFRCTNDIPRRYKSKAVEEAQKALREYLHATKSLPFAFSELIANNSPFSLSNLIRKVFFSAKTFSASLRKLLRYEPINEFEFFLESIGIDYHNVHRYLPRNKFFFSEDSTGLEAAFLLFKFGFPWNTLGKLYEAEVLIFSKSSDELSERLSLLKTRYGFDNLYVVGICLVFPYLLSLEGDLSSDFDQFFWDFKMVLAEIHKGSCVEGNVDSWYDVCRKVKIFYDLGCEKGKVGESMCQKKEFFELCSNEVLLQKVDYFSKFEVGKFEVGSLLLHSPEVLKLDLETPAISVSRLLEHLGLDNSELNRLSKKYPHVFGRNEMANLPEAMKALNLHQWCFDKIKSSNGQLLATYSIGCVDEGLDKIFSEAMKKIGSSRWARHTMNKVDFLKGIGFGENGLTVKVLNHLHGTSSELEERFDFLLGMGLDHSKLCLIVKSAPKILTQSSEKLEKKLNFLCWGMGYSLEYLDYFPEYLYYDLENRIKRRYRCYVWLRESSLRTRDYSVGSLIASSEKKFVEFLNGIHPAAPKHYFYRF